MYASIKRRTLASKAGVTVALAAVAVMAVGAGSAQASAFHTSFDDAALNVSGSTFDVLNPPNVATLEGTEVGGVITLPSPSPGTAGSPGFFFPQFTGEPITGVTLTVNFAATGAADITGTLDGTGAVHLASHSYEATVQVAGGSTCHYPVNFAFSTDPGSPFNGETFTQGPPDTTLTDGILATNWGPGALGSDPDMGCTLVNGLVSGSGGFELGNGKDLTPPPPPDSSGGSSTATGSAAPPPASTAKKCKKGFKLKKGKCKKKKKKK